MKHAIFILLFLHLSFCIHSQNINKADYKSSEIDSIIVSYVDFDIFTTYNVLCHDFYDTFSDAKYVIINNKAQIRQIMELLNSLEKISNNDYIDTRAKLYIYKKNTMMPVCVGKNMILYKNGNNYFCHTISNNNYLWDNVYFKPDD